MSSNWGNNLRISLFGESHGSAIGLVMDGLPAGVPIDPTEISKLLARRSPGQGAHTSSRGETDQVEIQSGLYHGRTTGTPLAAIIPNTDARPDDYEELSGIARPSHADYTGFVRYGGFADPRGGGHFSGRLTAPLVFAGSIAMQTLKLQDIVVAAQISAIGKVQDSFFDPVSVSPADLQALTGRALPVREETAVPRMLEQIEEARRAKDSIGGMVTCYALGLPPGIGSPMFGGVENIVSSLMFGIPGVKGISFGDGFGAALQPGSLHNDQMTVRDGKITCLTNHSGGIAGGITNGMPLIVHVALKPTPTIEQHQQTVAYHTMQKVTLEAKGRHDPCIVPRAVPCIEAAVALALLDLLLEGGNPNGFAGFAPKPGRD